MASAPSAACETLSSLAGTAVGWGYVALSPILTGTAAWSLLRCEIAHSVGGCWSRFCSRQVRRGAGGACVKRQDDAVRGAGAAAGLAVLRVAVARHVPAVRAVADVHAQHRHRAHGRPRGVRGRVRPGRGGPRHTPSVREDETEREREPKHP